MPRVRLPKRVLPDAAPGANPLRARLFGALNAWLTDPARIMDLGGLGMVRGAGSKGFTFRGPTTEYEIERMLTSAFSKRKPFRYTGETPAAVSRARHMDPEAIPTREYVMDRLREMGFWWH